MDAAARRAIIVFCIVLPLLIVFLRFRVRFELRFFRDGRRFRFSVRLRFGPLRLHLGFRPVFLRGRGLVLAAEKKNGLRIPKKNTRRKKQKRKQIVLSMLRCISLRSLSFEGSVGIPEDAAFCCFVAGALRVFLPALLGAASIAVPLGSAEFAPSPGGGIRPDFEKSAFDIRLRGIVEAVPAKLIKSLAAAKAREREYQSKTKKEKKYAPDRKHYANLHGADQAHGGR